MPQDKKNETIKTILSRRSVRAYKPNQIPQEELSLILDAGHAAPYVTPDSRHFAAISGRGILKNLNRAAIAEGIKLGDFQRELFSAPGYDGTYGAPIVVIVSGKEDTVQYEAVCAAAVQNMLLAATSLGIASCWAYFPIFAFHGSEAETWKADLNIEDGFKPCAAVLLGYAKEEEDS